ncbi:MAG: bifunctional hydroxymethylpyrimidine kinase/phosphomethylpyrimidine kinase [Proteobacteria bacterium]|nr:bifunctional hydroxymethylpyrimidine kinase/phosphomethylpyrimidine kinase [Pseudomonadota bacterium]
MTNSNIKKPVVLVLAGHDPGGGAGIQADIESIANCGCHAVTVITSLTTQNTNCVIDIIPQKPEAFKQQIQIILDDIEINACKIGIFGNAELIEIAHDQLSSFTVPIVLDPVITTGSGTVISDESVLEKITSLLVPIATIVTPNSDEARKLSNSDDLASAAEYLIQLGSENVLITGTHEETGNVINKFYAKDKTPREYRWQRLPNTYHGSGCTLSARIAAQLALGNNIQKAIEEAQEYTWNTLKHGLQLGQGQAQPDRFFKKRN